MKVGLVGLPASAQVGEEWNAIPDLQLAAAAEPDPLRSERASKHLPLTRIYPSWQEMLGKEDIHFLHVNIHGRLRTELVLNATSRGIHCLLEPPFAHSLESAVRMLDASREAGGRLLVNWSAIRNPAMIHAARLVEQGDFGAPFQIERRVTHGGSPPALPPRTPESFIRSAPILFQLCGEGANLCRTLIGLPNTCTAIGAVHRPPQRPVFKPARQRRSTDLDPLPPLPTGQSQDVPPASSPFPTEAAALDWQGALNELKRQHETPSPPRGSSMSAPPEDPPFDHLLAVLSYGSASGLLEGSWRDAITEDLPDAWIRGEGGTLVVRGHRLLRIEPGAAAETEILVPPLLEEQATGPALLHWSALQEQDIRGFGSLQGARDTQEILEAAIHSAEEGRTVRLPLR